MKKVRLYDKETKLYVGTIEADRNYIKKIENDFIVVVE